MEDFDFENKKKKYWSREEAVLNIQKYCVTQDRCHQEVRYKLLEYSIYGDLLEEILADLITNNFLDEERFAKSYASGKFRIKNWGKVKIKQELKKRDVSVYCINEAMKEIDNDEYLNTLKRILDKKENTTKFANQYDRYKKLTDFALSKGYEYDVIKELITS